MNNKQLYEKENNINKPFFPVVRLEDIIDTISEKSIQWILNNYNHIYVEWKNDIVGTRLSVPTILRRNGLWITYNNGDRLITEYYIGKNTEIKDKHWQDDANWEDYTNKLIDGTVEYRHLSENLKQLFNKGNVTNFPDEEDLTSDGVVLSFKDREYQPENFSGLGRVILRKNIVKIGEEYKNILTQSMINKENTIYEIRYDFDLNGQEITIPEGCVLDFQGGSLRRGSLLGNGAIIESIAIKIFDIDIQLENFTVEEWYPQWFGAVGDGVNDDRPAIQKCIDTVPKGSCIKFLSTPYFYNIASLTDTENKIAIKQDGKESLIIKGTSPFDKITIKMSVEAESLWGLYNETRSCTFSNISFEGNNKVDYCLRSYIDYEVYLTIEKCYFDRAKKSAVRLATYVSTFKECIFDNSPIGLEIGANCLKPELRSGPCTTITITSCYAHSCTIGYKLHFLTYCSLISCACDHATEVAYWLGNVYGSSMTGCGCENSSQLIYMDGTKNFSINNFYSLSCGGIDKTINYLIEINTAVNCSIQGVEFANVRKYNYKLGLIGKNFGSENITILDPSIEPDSVYSISNYHYNKPIKFVRRNFDNANFYVTDLDVSSVAKDKDLDKYVKLEYTSNLLLNSVNTINLSEGSHFSGDFENIRGGDLLIIGATDNPDDTIMVFRKYKGYLMNCRNIIFKNITITKEEGGTFQSLMYITDCNISFYNCKFKSNEIGNAAIMLISHFSNIYIHGDCKIEGVFNGKNIPNKSIIYTDSSSKYFIQKVSSEDELDSIFSFDGCIIENQRPDLNGITSWYKKYNKWCPINIINFTSTT